MAMDNRRRGQRPRRDEAGAPKAIFRQQVSRNHEDEPEEKPLSQLHGRALERALQEKFPKRVWQPSVMLVPNPVVMLSSGGGKSGYPANIITVAWAGIVNTDPPMISVSLRPERYSHEIISATKEFVVNIPTVSLVKAVDWCGMKSGREVDKFAEMKLTALPSEQVSCPLIAECPVNIECKLVKSIPLGSHDMFLAKIVSVQVSDNAIDKKGRFRVELAEVLGYAHGEYHELGHRIGMFGFSVRKHK